MNPLRRLAASLSLACVTALVACGGVGELPDDLDAMASWDSRFGSHEGGDDQPASGDGAVTVPDGGVLDDGPCGTGELLDAPEFIGPFPSWADAKQDYGAKGDGTTDDTAALQAALDDLGNAGQASVLFLPAGTYRITQTLSLRSRTSIAIFGADPATTTVRWAGGSGQTMFKIWGVNHARFGRITWDGADSAGTAVFHSWSWTGAPYFPTNILHEDEVYTHVGVGLQGGTFDDGGSEGPTAEVTIRRVKFDHCTTAGVSMGTWNSLDWWLWHCTFSACARGVTNEFGAGHFHVYSSLFLGSTVSDMSIANTQYFGIRRNVSIGSKKFFVASQIGLNTAPMTMQGNVIIDPQDALVIDIGNLGALMLIDNTIRSTVGTTGPVVRHADNDNQADSVTLSVGNTFTVDNAISTSGNGWVHSIGDSKKAIADIATPTMKMPPTAVSMGRQVFEVSAGASAATIQAVVAQAAAATARSVVHFSAGDYHLSQTVEVPPGADIQLVGDGFRSVLYFDGVNGAGIHLASPARATVRELMMDGGATTSALVLADQADQPGARVFAQSIFVAQTRDHAAFSDRLDHARVEYRSLQLMDLDESHGSWAALPWAAVQVTGGGAVDTGRTSLFGAGTTGSRETPDSRIFDVGSGGRLLVEDTWYEGKSRYALHLTGNGELTWNGGIMSYSAAPSPVLDPDQVPIVRLDGFTGKATLLGVFSTRHAEVTGGTPDLLALGVVSMTVNPWLSTGGAATVRELGSHYQTASGGRLASDVGGYDAPAVLAHLSQLRAECPHDPTLAPAQVTDLRLERLWLQNALNGVHVRKD